jgi:predicted dienelactone hydrolase
MKSPRVKQGVIGSRANRRGMTSLLVQRIVPLRFFALLILLMEVATIRLASAESVYDPLALQAISTVAAQPIDLTIEDPKRKRSIPIRVYRPAVDAESPVILFSHGLGGSREAAPYLGRHWSDRGYVVVFLQHPGSDESVWRDTPLRQRLQTLKGAASVQNFRDRVDDVTVTIDQLQVMHAAENGPLSRRLDLTKIAIAGHSFGAVTAQAVAGQRQPVGASLTDKRIKAALILSPSRPRNQLVSTQQAFGDVRVPWMLMTGTQDDSPLGDTTPESRLEVYPALPPGDKYELVLKDGEHHAFTERPEGAERFGNAKRNPNHKQTILALSTAFWDAHLRGDAAAKDWLTGKGPLSVLSPGDRWQIK